MQMPASAPRVYNAIYSSVQVYECMVRGIAVMRRRADSFVNATQILKVAGVDKGRRTKILEKEILPGEHEIVQGGYGKYQGTWIPLERGRDVAIQFGVAPLLAPLFDFMPTPASVGTMPPQARTSQSQSTYMPPHASTHPHYAPYGSRPVAPYPQNQLYPYTPSGHQASQPPLYAPGNSASVSLSAQSPLAPSANILSPPRTTGQLAQPHEPPEQAQPASSEISASSGIPAINSTAGQKRPRPDENARASPRSIYSATNHAVGDSPDDRRNGSPSKRARTDSERSLGQSPTLASASTPRDPHANTPLPPANGTATDVDLNWRYHTKPPQVSLSDRLSPLKSAKHRTILLSTINESDPAQVIVALTPQGATVEKDGAPLPEIDLIVDDQGHTPLHWAAALARIDLVDVLISHGADIHRGNYSGETPLIRSILSVHAFEQQCFPALLQSLSASIRTVDSSSRSVLHHIGHVAGIKSRGPSARYYMESVLEFVARNQKGDFKSLVDLQDVHGDTALNVAARVGNRSLVRMLVDVGANKSLANKLGLAPGDFGVEGENLSVPSADDVLASLRVAPSRPAQKSQDVISDMTSMIQGLALEFNAEVKSKQDALNATQAHLRVATRELAEQRRQIQRGQASCAELDQVQQRIRNLENALRDEELFDWTGRTEVDGTPTLATSASVSSNSDTLVGSLHSVAASGSAPSTVTSPNLGPGPAFAYRGPASTMSALGGTFDISFNLDADPAIPTVDNVQSLVRLRRMAMWHQRIETLMERRLERLRGDSAEKESQCRRIVSMCTGVPVDKIEQMLESLVIAMESDGPVPELGRVAGFMQRV